MNSDLVTIYRNIIEDQTLDLKQKKELLNEARKILSPDENRWNFRFVILTLALVGLSVPVWTLLYASIQIPQGLLSLSSTAVGALAGFLSFYVRRREDVSRTSRSNPIQPVSPPASPNNAVRPKSDEGVS